jgi:hypothetical protein
MKPLPTTRTARRINVRAKQNPSRLEVLPGWAWDVRLSIKRVDLGLN